MEQTSGFQSLILSPRLVTLKNKLIQPFVLSLPDNSSLVDSQKLKPAKQIYRDFSRDRQTSQFLQQKSNSSRSQSLNLRKNSLQNVKSQIRRLQAKDKQRYIMPPIKNIRKLLKNNINSKPQKIKIIKNYVDNNLIKEIDTFRKISRDQQKSIKNGQNSIAKYLRKSKSKNRKLVYYKPQQLRRRSSIANTSYEHQSHSLKANSEKKLGVSNLMRSDNKRYAQMLKNAQHFNIFQLTTQFKDIKYVSLSQIYSLNDKQQLLVIKNSHRVPPIPSKKEQIQLFINSYKPVNEQICLTNLLKNNFCAIEYSKKQVYVGEMIGKKKSGVGILFAKNYCFEGIWKNNNIVRGFQITIEGIYKGSYQSNKRQGKGQFQWNNGQLYVGDWSKGLQHGSGLWINQRGQSYNGQWKNGKIQGIGTLIIKTSSRAAIGRKYKGSFINFMQHGFGRQTFENGDSFQGIYRQDRPSGKGKYKWANGSVYQGDFKDGMRDGMGILTTPFQLLYKGQFRNDKPEGECEIILPNGDIYYGMVKDGRKNGKGTLHLKGSRQVFNGYWKNDYFIDKHSQI